MIASVAILIAAPLTLNPDAQNRNTDSLSPTPFSVADHFKADEDCAPITLYRDNYPDHLLSKCLCRFGPRYFMESPASKGGRDFFNRAGPRLQSPETWLIKASPAKMA